MSSLCYQQALVWHPAVQHNTTPRHACVAELIQCMNAIRPFVNKAIWQSLSDAACFEIFATLEVRYIPSGL